MHLNFNPDLTKPLTDEELSVAGFEQFDGNFVVFDLRDVPQAYQLPAMVLCPALPPKLLNIVQAAPHMYQQLGREFAMLQNLIDNLETVNAQVKRQTGQPWGFAVSLVTTFTQMQDQILQARRIAVEGPEKVAAEVRAEFRIKG